MDDHALEVADGLRRLIMRLQLVAVALPLVGLALWFWRGC